MRARADERRLNATAKLAESFANQAHRREVYGFTGQTVPVRLANTTWARAEKPPTSLPVIEPRHPVAMKRRGA